MLKRERKFNRHRNFDYSLDGCYFVTFCVKNFTYYLGEIKNNQMTLNKYGEIVKQQLLWLTTQFLYIRLSEWCVMPNHLHAIIIIDRSTVGTGRDLSLPMKIKSLSEFVGALKTTSSKLIHLAGLKQFCWQRSFFDRVIRDDKELESICWYIQNNPLNWHKDRNNPRSIM